MISTCTNPILEKNSSVYAASSLTGTTFKDVSSNSWFYSSVKSAYDNGLMEGVGKGYFSPNNNFTLAQAITVAARMYATSKGESIKCTDSTTWYQPYIDYAISKNLLSDSMINTSNISSVNATRAETAFLFNNVLKSMETCTQSINTSTIPDLNRISLNYRQSVQSLYEAGIITGMPNGNFDGNSNVTRAQISTIINRIIDNQERIPYDENYNYDLNGQEGNIYSDYGYIVYDDKYSYHVVSSSSGTADIVRYDLDSKMGEVIYRGNGELQNLRLKNGNLYFWEFVEGVFDTSIGGARLTEYADIVVYNFESRKASTIYSASHFKNINSTVTGTDFSADSVPLFNGNGKRIITLVVEDTVYVAYDVGDTIYKLLGDGSISAVSQSPCLTRNYIRNHDNIFFISEFFQPINAPYRTIYNTGYNSTKKQLNVAENSYLNATISATGHNPAVINLNSLSDNGKNTKFTVEWTDTKLGMRYITYQIDSAVYYKYKDKNRNDYLLADGSPDFGSYVANPEDDYLMYTLAQAFKSLKEKERLSNACPVENIAGFVQNLKYVSDAVGTRYDEYPKFPIETLYDKGGDCEDSSILLASLLKELDFKVIMTQFPGHILVAVACEGATGDYIEYKGAKYYYIETTDSGWRLGELPNSLNEDEVYVWSL